MPKTALFAQPAPRRAVLGLAGAAFLTAGSGRGATAATDAQSASAILDRYVDLVNAHNAPGFAAVCTDDYIQHSGRTGSGLTAQIENFRAIFERWPDIRMQVDDRIFGDGKLVARNTFLATHTRVVLGIAPTGRRVSFRTIDIWRVAGGKFAEHWDIVDTAGLEKQLRGG